jgi:transcriptional regulator with XRE-family HTH domain
MFLMDVNGKAFCEARLDKFVSQETLARMAGVSPNAIKRIEKGNKIGADLLRKVLPALGISIEEAFAKHLIKQV